MRRNYIIGAILAIAVFAVLIFRYYGGHQTPSGQPPLENLTARNVTDIKNAFNAANDDVRVLLLLSPT